MLFRFDNIWVICMFDKLRGLFSKIFSVNNSDGQGDSSEALEREIISRINGVDSSNYTDMRSLFSGKESKWFDSIRSRPDSYHALRSDPRVSYTIHAPKGFFDDPDRYRLIVLVHGSERSVEKYRDEFVSFADENDFVILVPIFPIGIHGDGFADGYKNISERDTRYDHLLFDMISDFSEASCCAFDKFFLAGFSGGGQFVQRFFYLYPERLFAVSIGSPGICTKIDNGRPWIFGTKGIGDKFGVRFSIDKLRSVPVQILVGDMDTEDLGIPEKYMGIASKILGKFGSNRLENMQILQENYEENGLNSHIVIVNGAAHDGVKVLPACQDFFLKVRLGTKG